jgi:DnaK suppressor protein
MDTVHKAKSHQVEAKKLPTMASLKPRDEIMAELVADRESHLRELERLHVALLELPEVSVEEADPAVGEHAQTILTIKRVEEHLAEIERAIQTVGRADYGVCEKCGEVIDPERMRVLPETRLCIKCKRESERFKSHHVR